MQNQASQSKMNNTLLKIQELIYQPLNFEISELKIEAEGQQYRACQFLLNERKIISRNSKITPKKIGQFVTFWKRNEKGITIPFHKKDPFDFYVVNLQGEGRIGQFVFPKSVLIQKEIVSTSIKGGKRGFRVYPNWDLTLSKQAIKTQQWQLEFFFEISAELNLNGIAELYDLE